MPRKRKITAELREKAWRLRGEGKSFPEIAAELGLSSRDAKNAARKRPHAAGEAAPSSPAPDAPPPARVQVAPAPEAAPLPSPAPPPAASTGTGPTIEDQLKAEGIDLGPRGPAVAAPPGAGGDRVRVEAHPFTPGAPPPPGAGPAVDGEQLIEFSETVKGVNVLLQCERYGVKLPPELLEKLAHFTPGQKKALGIFAPYAAPYVSWLISHHDKVAGILFLVVLAAMIVGDAKTIKGLAPKKDPEEKPKAPAAAPPAIP
jgi:hypothetical protein